MIPSYTVDSDVGVSVLRVSPGCLETILRTPPPSPVGLYGPSAVLRIAGGI